MEKKRVGVITFHNYDNYGAILQSYALQKSCRNQNTQPIVIITAARLYQQSLYNLIQI